MSYENMDGAMHVKYTYSTRSCTVHLEPVFSVDKVTGRGGAGGGLFGTICSYYPLDNYIGCKVVHSRLKSRPSTTFAAHVLFDKIIPNTQTPLPSFSACTPTQLS